MTAHDFGRQHKRLPYFLNNFFFLMYSLSYRLKSLSPFCTVIDLFGYVDCKTVDSFLKIGLV